MQSSGTAKVATFFGPIMVVFFGLIGVRRRRAISPTRRASCTPSTRSPAWSSCSGNGSTGFVTLGLVFLAVTGAEALYADMGHFGRKPIQIAWLFFVLPSLICNYLGQGALVLNDPTRR